MIKKGHGKDYPTSLLYDERVGPWELFLHTQLRGGLKMLTRNICSEYGQYNIQCNGLGLVVQLLRQHLSVSVRLMVAVIHSDTSFICAKTPAGRWLEPERVVSPAVSWLQMLLMQ